MTDFLKVLLATVLRLVVTASVVVIGALLLLFGLTVAAGVMLWSLVTGRKPVFAFRVDPRTTMAAMRQRAAASSPGARPRAPVDVIDVEVREVPDTGRRVPD